VRLRRKKAGISINGKELIANKDYAAANNMLFFETSASTSTGVSELFYALATKIYENNVMSATI
jgi:GTPase SAR1 family protein